MVLPSSVKAARKVRTLGMALISARFRIKDDKIALAEVTRIIVPSGE
jgi:hypothetical protein